MSNILKILIRKICLEVIKKMRKKTLTIDQKNAEKVKYLINYFLVMVGKINLGNLLGNEIKKQKTRTLFL